MTELAEELCVLEDRKDVLTKELEVLELEKKKGNADQDVLTKEKFDALVSLLLLINFCAMLITNRIASFTDHCAEWSWYIQAFLQIEHANV